MSCGALSAPFELYCSVYFRSILALFSVYFSASLGLLSPPNRPSPSRSTHATDWSAGSVSISFLFSGVILFLFSGVFQSSSGFLDI